MPSVNGIPIVNTSISEVCSSVVNYLRDEFPDYMQAIYDRFEFSKYYPDWLERSASNLTHCSRAGIDRWGNVSFYISVTISQPVIRHPEAEHRGPWDFVTAKGYLFPDSDGSGGFTVKFATTDSRFVQNMEKRRFEIVGEELPYDESKVFYSRHFSAGEVPTRCRYDMEKGKEPYHLRVEFPYTALEFHKKALELISAYVESSRRTWKVEYLRSHGSEYGGARDGYGLICASRPAGVFNLYKKSSEAFIDGAGIRDLWLQRNEDLVHWDNELKTYVWSS